MASMSMIHQQVFFQTSATSEFKSCGKLPVFTSGAKFFGAILTYGSFCFIINVSQYLGGIHMNCNKCGAEMDENAKFCTECGARFDSEPEPEKADAEAQETAEQIISADVSPETNSNEAAETIEEAESQPSAEPVPEEKTAEEVPVNTAVINDESSRFPVGNDNTNSESVRENFEQTIDTPAVERISAVTTAASDLKIFIIFSFTKKSTNNICLPDRY